MQYAIVILDGASGDPVPEFGGLTTFEASQTPHLDRLAQSGTVGLMQNVPDHMVSGSDVACMSIMGYDPAHYAVGRGMIEGAALGIDLEPGQVALRVNLCCVEEGIMRSYSTDNLTTEDGHAFCEELKAVLDDDTFTLYPGTSFRQILVVNGYPELVGLDYQTPHDNSGKDVTEAYKPIAHNTAEQQAADILVDYIHRANEVLAKSPLNKRRIQESKLPANHIWAFWPGMKPDSLKSFKEAYGKTAAMNSAVDLLDGLAFMTGMKTYKFKGVTDGPTNDFAAQGRGGLEMLEAGNDVVIIHVEAPDAAGHDGRPDEKKNSIEQSDATIMAPLMEYARNNPLRIAVMPDHPTPLSTRKHSKDPVPFLVFGPGINYNGAKRLTESEAKSTGLMVDPGYKFMGDILFAD